MEPGELLLLDAGARHRIHNADLTRTVPVDGRFDGAARDVYSAVLQAERAAIAACTPGTAVEEVHRAALGVLVPAMVDLGLLGGDPDEVIERKDDWKPYFPHNTSHWLGLDVHDVGTYAHRDGPRLLEPGMVLTIEPGLYTDSAGYRHSDTVAVTEDGTETLTYFPRDLEGNVIR